AAHRRGPGEWIVRCRHLEGQPSALPAGEHAAIERGNLVRLRGDEIVIEGRVVELDRVSDGSERKGRAAEERGQHENAPEGPQCVQGHAENSHCEARSALWERLEPRNGTPLQAPFHPAPGTV